MLSFDDYLDDNVFSFDIHSLDPIDDFTTTSFDGSHNPFCFDWIVQQSQAYQPPAMAKDEFCVNPSLATSIPSSYTTYAESASTTMSSSASAAQSVTLSPSMTETSIDFQNTMDRLGSSAGSSSSASSSEESQAGPIRKFKCPICPRAFARQFNLKQHIHTHDPDRIKPHECTYNGCGRRFSRKHDLVRHAQSIHGVAGPPTKSTKKQSPQAIADMIAKRQNARKKTTV